MNLKKYVEKLNTVPPYELYLMYAYYQKETKQINSTQFEGIITEIEQTTVPAYFDAIRRYLDALKQRATPEAIRGAKKSREAYMQYLIYLDLRSGKIAPYEAETAKQLLHADEPNLDNMLGTDG
ncbi:MAG: hypothetical protein EOP51_17165 [Sphingobacteriales bacterium]|nr:MAG: hypothetical protein EOP51_17165 [Sphingobacteriales bacterium]